MHAEAECLPMEAFRDDLVQLLRKYRVKVSRGAQPQAWYFESLGSEEMLSMNEIKVELSMSRTAQFDTRS